MVFSASDTPAPAIRRPARRAIAGLVLAAALLSGCAASPSGGEPSASDTATPDPTQTQTQTPTPEPTPTDAGTPAEQAAALVESMTVAERARTVVMGHVAGTDGDTLSGYMADTGVGGFLLMGENVPGTPEELRAATDAMSVDGVLPPLIAVDEEGGDVTRLPWDDVPAAAELKQAPAQAAEDAFASRGALVAESGIGVNFGIVADVAPDASSFIYGRALGTDPQSVADRVAAAVRGEQTQVLSTLKHFPGHGAAPGDSHAGIPSSDMPMEQWLASDALPFRAGIDAGAALVMTGHLRYTAVDQLPASLSPQWHRILRDELGFSGVAVTDDLGMLESSGDPAFADPVANAVTAIAAGNDLALTVVGSTAQTAPAQADGIAAAVESGALPAQRLQEAATRVVALRLQLAQG